MRLLIDTKSVKSYSEFLKIKGLPRYEFQGRTAIIPDEYADRLGKRQVSSKNIPYTPSEFCFDYQADISRIAIRKRKFAVFARCGLGKTIIFLEYVRAVRTAMPQHQNILIVDPLMVVEQVIEECQRFYGDSIPIEHVTAANINSWASKTGRIGIANYEAVLKLTSVGNIGCLVLDEGSTLKNLTGAQAETCINLGKGLEFKIVLTGTPAPNDRIEYANTALFLDQVRTTNEFMAKYFVNRGQTQNRWELKPHALKPFYRDMSHWCIFLNNPAVYGWKDNCDTLPPIHVHIHDVDMTDEQYRLSTSVTGSIIPGSAVGGIGSRGKLAQIAKGNFRGRKVESNKPEFIRQLVNSWPDESTILWCKYNTEQELIASLFPDCANISGDTPYETRKTLIADFKAGRRKQLVTKPEILGFGQNLQICTRQVFSTLHDSYEDYWQCICRSNRVGSTKDLNVHIPLTDIERPMVQTVLDKADRVDYDNAQQEQLFKEVGFCF